MRYTASSLKVLTASKVSHLKRLPSYVCSIRTVLVRVAGSSSRNKCETSRSFTYENKVRLTDEPKNENFASCEHTLVSKASLAMYDCSCFYDSIQLLLVRELRFKIERLTCFRLKQTSFTTIIEHYANRTFRFNV